MMQQEKISEIRQAVAAQTPLIHCITNPISINLAANGILALGARPIMAEHPAEVAQITAMAQALALNLGNITDARIEAMPVAAASALANNIPVVLDLVGVGISEIRHTLAKQLVASRALKVVKGNLSEILAMLGEQAAPQGIDVGKADVAKARNLGYVAEIAARLAKVTGAVVLVTGAIDVIATADKAWSVANGVSQLAAITGTGCLLNCIVATYMSVASPLEAAVLGALHLAVAGEIAAAVPPTAKTMVLGETAAISATSARPALANVAVAPVDKAARQKIPNASFQIRLLDSLQTVDAGTLFTRAAIEAVRV